MMKNDNETENQAARIIIESTGSVLAAVRKIGTDA